RLDASRTIDRYPLRGRNSTRAYTAFQTHGRTLPDAKLTRILTTFPKRPHSKYGLKVIIGYE
ncbi:MAG: hypothetical protein ACREDR_37480, partial [Blastocatellia bacterium]